MDYGWTNDLFQIATHSVEEEDITKSSETMPIGYNPFSGHYEETETEAHQHYLITGAPLAEQVPLEFGTLSHPNTKNGRYYMRYFKGDTRGLARPEDGGAYECAKYNQRLNPSPRRVGNYSVNSGHQRTVDDMKAGSLVHFPNIGGLVTSGMYKASGVAFAKEEVTQTSSFFEKLWNNRDLRSKLMEELFPQAETLSNFTRTCQTIRMGVDQQIGFFNTENLDFGLCDRTPSDLEDMVQRGVIAQDTANNVRVPKFLVVGPLRQPQVMARGFKGDPEVFWPPQVEPKDATEPGSHEDLFDQRGFRTVNAYCGKAKKNPFQRKCVALQNTLHTLHQHRANIHYLALVQMDFMSLDTVLAMIQGLENLKCLCIYSCPLLDLAKVRELISVIGLVNQCREAAGKHLLDLDIAPQLRQGHLTERMGSYGITQSDPRIYKDWRTDIGCALAANLVSLIREAKKAKIELCQPGKAFRRWVDRLPLEINQAFNLIVAADNYVRNPEEQEGYANYTYYFDDVADLRPALMERMDETVSMDLTIAALARPISRTEFQQLGEMYCVKCKETLPGVLFRGESRARRPEHRICEACDLHAQLYYEDGNFQHEKNLIAQFLWRKAPKDDRLAWVVGDSPLAIRNNQKFLRVAGQLWTPKQCLEKAASLNEERQVIINRMLQIFDYRISKPLEKERDRIDAQIELWKIRAGGQRKPRTGMETEYDWEYRRKVYVFRGEVERGLVVHQTPYSNFTMTNLEHSYHMNH